MSLYLPLDEYLRQNTKKYQALYHCIRDMIISGRFAAGSALPSTRGLSQTERLSRGTVNLAFEMLSADGYVTGLPGSRTIVTWKAPPRRKVGDTVGFALSRWGRRLPAHPTIRTAPPLVRHFLPGYIDRTLFPHADWKRCMLRAVRQYDPLSAAPASGVYDLRNSVAHYLNRRRGLNVTPDQVAIVNGSIQAIALLCQLLLDKESGAVMENPGYRGTHQAISLSGARPTYAAVDDHGVIPGNWNARLAFLTPARQFPTGSVLPITRRLQWIDWARKHNAVIVEDDYDAEFRRGGKPIEPLQILSPERVVHIGTFSRTLSPFLRIGYAVLPESLIDPFRRAREGFENHASAWLEQTALAEFLRSGAYERHLRRSTRAYAERHAALVDGLRESLPGAFRMISSDTGLHLFGYWKGRQKTFKGFMTACAEEGILLADAARFFFLDPKPAALFSFAHMPPYDITSTLRHVGHIYKTTAAKT